MKTNFRFGELNRPKDCRCSVEWCALVNKFDTVKKGYEDKTRIQICNI